MSIVKQGVFNVIGDSVIYIGKKTENTIEDIFISYIAKDEKINTNGALKSRKGSDIVTAKSGRYISDQRGNLFITLDKGFRQELDENNSMISMLSFDNFSYNVSQFVKKYAGRTSKAYEKTQSELLDMAQRTTNPKLRDKYLSEYHGRIVMSLIPVINAIITLGFILISGTRSKRPSYSVGIFLVGIVFQIITITLINVSSRYGALIYANYFIVLLIILAMILVISRKKAR
jgi:lipopolysaccharide export LptBFGC system permease protein LptF